MYDLSIAINIATWAHRKQTGKDGEPYILHPLRVMLAGKTDVDRMVGVLHDVIEDTTVTLDDLRGSNFSGEVIAGVEAMTRRNGEDYMAFIVRCKANPVARRVKLADLADNMNLDRIPNPCQADFDRILKYRQARTFLLCE